MTATHLSAGYVETAPIMQPAGKRDILQVAATVGGNGGEQGAPKARGRALQRVRKQVNDPFSHGLAPAATGGAIVASTVSLIEVAANASGVSLR